jgi:hypothetical protein
MFVEHVGRGGVPALAGDRTELTTPLNAHRP